MEWKVKTSKEEKKSVENFLPSTADIDASSSLSQKKKKRKSATNEKLIHNGLSGSGDDEAPFRKFTPERPYMVQSTNSKILVKTICIEHAIEMEVDNVVPPYCVSACLAKN